MKKLILSLVLTSGLLCAKAQQIDWFDFNQSAFNQAKSEQKYILLNLKANWCHWCHVMEDSTYSNQNVVEYLAEHYICTEADQDANPELANRYRNFGWPATIVFDSQGNEIVKRRGYINPRSFEQMLKAIVADPSPELERNTIANSLDNSEINQRYDQLQKNLIGFMDIENGGYNQDQKYVDYDAMEFALLNIENDSMLQWINTSTNGAYQLNDPDWNGIYQYSTHGDWQHRHFEKLLSIQARYIDIFLDDYWLNNRLTSLLHAQKISQYCRKFFKQSDGLFASAQDADLEAGKHSGDYYQLSSSERFALGIPKIDSNTFTNSNAALASSFMRLGIATNSTELKKIAIEIIEHLKSNRTQSTGLYSHSKNAETVALDDNLAMCKSLLRFYQMTQDSTYLSDAAALLDAIKSFMLTDSTFADPSKIKEISPEPILAENIAAARLYNLAGKLLNRKDFQGIANTLLSRLYSDLFYRNNLIEGSMICLKNEVENDLMHYTLVLPDNSDLSAFSQFLLTPGFYKSTEVFYANELTAKQKDLFGEITEPVIFRCTESYCSQPIYDISNLDRRFISSN